MGDSKLTLEDQSAESGIGVSTLIVGHAFAPYWLEDACREARGDNWHNTRREIVFSAAFLETYLFEWAQSQLADDADELLRLFPQESHIPSLKVKWKRTVSIVFDTKALGTPPDTSDEEFLRLVDLRNSLLHARSSRLVVSSSDERSWPVPSAEELQKIPNGWALGVALRVVHDLHSHAGTREPEYVSQIAA